MNPTKSLLCTLVSIVILYSLSCSKSGATTSPSPQKDTSTVANRFRIATYNMRVDSKSDSFSWSGVRKYLAAAIIKKYKFDILGAQELYYSQLKDVMALTDSTYRYVGVATGNGRPDGTESFDALFFRKTRFDVLLTGDFWYSTTPNIPSVSWNAAVKTHCTWAKLKDLQTGKVFFVFNGHMIFNNAVAQMNSSAILADKVKTIASGYPVFCTGDYNTAVNTPSIQAFLDSTAYVDAKGKASILFDTKNGGTFAGFEKNVNADWRIDLILLNNYIKVWTYTVVQDDFTTPGSASDHLPVYIDASLN